MQHRIRDIGLSLVLTIFGLVMAGAIIEVALRLMPKGAAPINDRPKTYFSPENSDNLQDFRVVVPKPKNTFRIAAVGDSFTFGPYLQFDDTYPKRMERWLNLNTDQHTAVEVINYGVPRFSTFHEVGSVKKALEAGADLILLQITLNDPEEKLDWPTELIPDEAGHLKTGGPLRFLRNLKIVQFVMQRLENTRSQRMYKEYFFKLFEKDTKDYEKFLNAFTEIRKLCERYKVPLVAVVFPLFGIEVGDKYPFWPIHDQIKSELALRSIPMFDISKAFTGLPVERLQVLPGYDRHPNEIGHRIAAEEIIQELERRKLLPTGTFPRALEPRRIGINRSRATSAAGNVSTENQSEEQ